MSPAQSRLLTPREVADRLGVSLRTINRMRGDGRLVWIEITSRIWKVRECDLDAFIEANARGGEDPAFSTVNVSGGRGNHRPTAIVPFSKRTRC